MDKSAVAGLLHTDTREAMLQRKLNQFQSIPATNGYITRMAGTVSAWLGFGGFNRMCPVSKPAANHHRFAVIGAQCLQSLHERGIHPKLAGMLTAKFAGAEVWVVVPVHTGSG